MAYWFSLLVRTGKNWLCETETFVLKVDNLNPITVSSYDHRFNLNDKSLWRRADVDKISLVFSSDGYVSEESAADAAKKLCNSLILAAGHGMPIDPGFARLLNENTPWEVGRGRYNRRHAGYSGGGRTWKFQYIGEEISKFSEHPVCTIEQVRASAHICNATIPNGIKTSLDDGYSLFMARVSALEALAPSIDKNERVRRFLDEAIQSLSTQDYLNEDDRVALRRALGNAKKESISAKCRTFIREHENNPNMPEAATEASQHGLSTEERFGMIYTLRSNFTHGSAGPEEGIVTLEKHDTARQCGFDVEKMIELFLPTPR